MILEGFEIENWSCIKRVCVSDLPPNGVIVCHGPNGTGKSSIVAALRACLMDYASTATSKDLRRWFPKNSSEKPRVSVTFRAGGASWRITKQFGTSESKLEMRTAAGAWKLEKATAKDAHEEARKLVGGTTSDAGLHQLLWLTQAEFQLPDPKKLDGDVQSQLRAVLGVLQTPLDDQFLGRVKGEWSRWFTARSKPGEAPKRKKECQLEKDLACLVELKVELVRIETEFMSFEKMMERAGDLEVQSRDLRRQLEERSRACASLQQEYEQSLRRLEAHRIAKDRVAAAEKALADAQVLKQARADAELRIRDAESALAAAGREAEEKSGQLQAAEQSLRDLRRELHALGNTARELQSRLDEVNSRTQILTLKEQLATAQENSHRAEQTSSEFEELLQQARKRAAPDAPTLKRLEANRMRATQLRADLEAAAITLLLKLEPGATAPRVAIDGAPAMEGAPAADQAPISRSFRRRAEITIAGWGHLELSRGSDARSLDELENELAELDRQFAEELAPYGVAAGAASALDQLRELVAEQKVRDPELQRKRAELGRLAPEGLEPLRQEVTRLEKLVLARESAPASATLSADLPSDAVELDRIAAGIKGEIETKEGNMAALQQQVEEREREIEGVSEALPAAGKKSARADQSKTPTPGLRQREAAAKERLATLTATATVYRGELERMPTAEQLDRAIANADAEVNTARGDLTSAKLSDSEETIRARLDASNEGVRALQGQLSATEREFHHLKGALSHTEGLHQKRAAAAARVDELARQTERESLESEAYDRLYALFEECREKQLGTVMGPIHDRVLRWMRLLRLSSYQAIRFNDQFLPEKLVAGDGAIEFGLGEESTGTIEQIALMVRLALGATLSTPEEPVVAVLDDPLTHSDVVRMGLMSAVLKNATGGDSSALPPAGPLQIIVLTCHPEWFAIDGATIIDLSSPNVLTRSC